MTRETSPAGSVADNPYRTIVEAMNEGALILSGDGKITFCNHALARLLKRPAGQVHGTAIYDFVVDSDCERLRQTLAQPLGHSEIAVTLRSSDAHPIPTRFSVSKPGNDIQPAIVVVVITLDTQTRQLAESAQDLADFTHAVAHDLRTPLRHIHSFADLLADHLQADIDDQSRHYLDVITKSTTQMSILIDQLTFLYRIGSAGINFQSVDLNVLIRQVVDSFQPETIHRNIEWDIETLPEACGDRELLQTVFANLIANALKFTHFQAVAKIRIAVEDNPADPRFFVLAVQDNGIGFDTTDQEKLFGVFQKMHNHHELPGNGIGLAIVKRIVQKHGGQVWAKGALNQGAALYISLPKFEANPSIE